MIQKDFALQGSGFKQLVSMCDSGSVPKKDDAEDMTAWNIKSKLWKIRYPTGHGPGASNQERLFRKEM